MDKFARKPSSDPAQEKLRQNKAVWNKEVSAFINDLINLKKMMNGWPSKFHMEKSFIKDPIPADPSSILGVLASDFQDLAQRGNTIIEQQLEYSKNRKQKQPKQVAGPAPSPSSPPSLTQQLVASSEYQLVAEGSNPLTRFYSTLKGPWFGGSPEARARKYRLSMLKSATTLEKELKRLEATILGSSGESIFVAGRLLLQIESHLKFMNNALAAFGFEKSKPEGSKTSDASLQYVENILGDFKKNYLNFTDLDKSLVDKLANLRLSFMPLSKEDQVRMVPEIVAAYQAILNDANQKHGTNASSLTDILMASKTASLETVAQNIVDKWLGQLKHNVVPFDKTSPIRLDINKASESARDILDKLMDSLEKGINEIEIGSYLEALNEKFIEIRALMRPLEATIQNKLFDKEFVNLLERNKLTDYPSDLSSKQKDQLQKMLQTRQFRELTQTYRR